MSKGPESSVIKDFLWKQPSRVHSVHDVATDADADAMTSSPQERLAPGAIVSFFEDSRRFIAVHRVEVDNRDIVTDARLCAWNDRYAEVRNGTIHSDQSMLATYLDGAAAVECVRTAWEEGLVHQVFGFTADTASAYRQQVSPGSIDVLWRRVGNYIVEVGTEMGVLGVGASRSGVHEAGMCTRSSRAKAAVRQEIGEDLHDSIIQQLFASVLRLNSMATRTVDGDAADNLRLVAQTLSGAIAELRELISGLHGHAPTTLRADLEEAVDYIVDASGVRCTVLVADEVEAAGLACGGDVHAALHMAARELVSNAVRHGQAAAVEVRLDTDGVDLFLTVTDDGVGCTGPVSGGNGLPNLQRRAARLGGTMSLRPGVGGGTTAVWQVPLLMREDTA